MPAACKPANSGCGLKVEVKGEVKMEVKKEVNVEVKEVKIAVKYLELLYGALVRHDGPSMCPDWSDKDQTNLTDALDSLRLALRRINDD